MKNRSIIILVVITLVAACAIPAFSSIKGFLKNWPLRPIMNRDIAALYPMLEASIGSNDGKYPKVDYGLPGLNNRFLVKRDFDKFSAALLKETGLFYQDIILERERADAGGGNIFRTDIKNGRNDFALPDNLAGVNNFSVKNVSSSKSMNMALVLNGRDWSSMDGIVSAIIPEGASDKNKAFAIWGLLKDEIVHFDPPDRGAFTHDPVKLLNITGYGICDDAAISFAALAKHAGLRARVWGLTGHVTAEVFYDDAWHMFDPDQGIYYLTLDDEKVASVAVISEDAATIIGKTKEPKFNNKDRFIKVYGTRGDNRVIDNIYAMPSSYHEIRFDLLPGEEMTFSYKKRGPWYAKDSWLKPPVTGSVTDSIALSDKETFSSVQNSGVELKDGALAGIKAGSYIAWSHELPYPILDMRIGCEAITGGNPADVEVLLSKDGKRWLRAGGLATGLSTISLKRFIANFSAEPSFKYFVKLLFLKEGLSVARLTSEAEAQANLPGPFKFKPGDNIFEMRADNDAVLRLTVNYDRTDDAR